MLSTLMPARAAEVATAAMAAAAAAAPGLALPVLPGDPEPPLLNAAVMREKASASAGCCCGSTPGMDMRAASMPPIGSPSGAATAAAGSCCDGGGWCRVCSRGTSGEWLQSPRRPCRPASPWYTSRCLDEAPRRSVAGGLPDREAAPPEVPRHREEMPPDSPAAWFPAPCPAPQAGGFRGLPLRRPLERWRGGSVSPTWRPAAEAVRRGPPAAPLGPPPAKPRLDLLLDDCIGRGELRETCCPGAPPPLAVATPDV
mmetsp:Transcript_110381/g.330123  ORF Transcript_110381/g.330123 Transcript_110381/m.330123 type:complete len:256 (-) Transcript_110381:444-1211(-)